MDVVRFREVLQYVEESFGVDLETEHEFIHEAYDSDIPLFKLLLAQQPDGQGSKMIVSFHIDMDIPSAIQWFMRLKQFEPETFMTASYIKDSNGTSYVGEDAEAMRLYIIEQHVISGWIASNTEIEKKKSSSPPPPPKEETKTFTEKRAALIEFNRMRRSKTDTCH